MHLDCNQSVSSHQNPIKLTFNVCSAVGCDQDVAPMPGRAGLRRDEANIGHLGLFSSGAFALVEFRNGFFVGFRRRVGTSAYALPLVNDGDSFYRPQKRDS
jgi:hypothetical protein